jgi:hypothetical protein
MDCLRKIAASLAFLLAIGAANASEVLDAALRACRAEADDARRLACYDREIDRSQAAARQREPATAAVAAPVPEAAPAPAAAPAAAPTAEEMFGREGAMAQEESERKEKETRALGELQAKVTEIWTRSDGLMVVTLDNGQVWKQNRPDSFFRLKSGDTVKIQPAALGSYLMSGPSKRSTRVTRLK